MDRRALILFKTIHREATVASAGRDHDCASLDPLVCIELDRTRVVAAFELYGLVGDGDFHTKFLRLAEGAAHKRHSRNSSRKAKIILNSCRSARLPTK